jgi:hypothetical protein
VPQLRRIFFIILALAIAEAAFANGLGGERLEKVVGDLIVDVGTDQPSTPLAGQPIEFDFDLLQSKTREPINLATSVGIDIGHDGKSMVNCDLVVESPITFLIYTFPEPGKYTLTVAFFNKNLGQQRLAIATFPLTISGTKGNNRALYLAALFASIILGLLAGYWGARRRRSG